VGRIKTFHSPLNTPVFAIKKKSDKWHLLQDLRALSKVMHPVGSLQPRFPSPTIIPLQNYLYIIFFFRCWGPNSGPCHLPGKRSSNELNTQPRDLPLEATVLHLFALHCLLAKAPDSAYNFPPKVL
jgi:hypothetical protein